MMNIYDISGNVWLSDVPVTNSAEWVQELMRSDYVQLSWNSDSNEVIPVGAYILVGGEKYSLIEPYSPGQKTEGQWQYKPQFHSVFFGLLSKVPFFMYTTTGSVTTKEADWKLTDSPVNFMRVLTEAIYKETGIKYTFAVDNNLQIASADLQFNCVDINSASTQIANAFETELWLEKFSTADTDGNIGCLHLGKALIGEAKVLEVGANIKPPSVTKNGEYFNRFYVFGSSRNITQDYQGANVNNIATKRLTLNPAAYPNGYLDFSNGGPVYSKVLQFDDIYPSATDLVVTDIRPRTRYRLNEDTSEKIVLPDGSYDEYSIWYVQLKRLVNGAYVDFDFDESTYNKDSNPNGMLLPNLVPSIHFNSGPLAGREFEVIYHKTGGTEQDGADAVPFVVKPGDFEIKFQEESGFILPAMTGLVPQTDNLVVLFNVKMPSAYETSAQDRLAEVAIEEINKNYLDTDTGEPIDRNEYRVQSDPTVFMVDDPGLVLGARVVYRNGEYEKETRVTALTRRLDYACYQTITFGDEIVKGNIEELKEEAVSANRNIDLLAAISKSTGDITAAYERTHQLILKQLAEQGSIWLREQYQEDGVTKTRAKLNPVLTGAYAEGFLTAGGVGSGGGGDSGGGGIVGQLYRYADLGRIFSNSANDTFNAYTINQLYLRIKALEEQAPADERLSYVDPDDYDDITIIDDGRTGTVLWGAESAYRVALDVNGISKILLKEGALDNPLSRISVLEGYFISGKANNAIQLNGHPDTDFALASDLSALRNTVSGLVTGVHSVVGESGDVTVSQIATALTTAGYKLTDTTYSAATASAAGLMSSADKAKLDGIASGATNVTEGTVSGWGFTKTAPYSLPIAAAETLGGIRVGYTTSGKNYKVQLDANGNAFVNVPWTDSLGTVTRVDIGSVHYSPIDGVVSLPAYPTIPTDVSAFTNDAGYLTEHQSLAGYVNNISTGTGNYISGVSKSGSTLNFTYGTLGDAAFYGVGSIASGNTGLVTGGAVYSAINTAVSSAIKFQGITATALTDGAATNPIIIEGTTYTANRGDMVVHGGLEFLWTGSKWQQMGDESSYALKTITVTGTGYLTGGGDLTANRTIDLTTAAKNKIDAAITENQTITLSGVVSGSGKTSIVTSIADGNITNAMLANSALTIAGISVSLGGSISASSLLGALDLTDVVLPLSEGIANVAGRVASLEDWLLSPAMDEAFIGLANVDELNLGGNTLASDGAVLNWNGGALLSGLSSSTSTPLSVTVGGKTLTISSLVASRLATTSKTAWGRTYWTASGVPDSISGDISNAGNITPTSTLAFNLGSDSLAWKRLYLGNGVYFEYDAVHGGVQLVGAGFYTESYVAAGGVGSSSGSGIDLDRVWDSLTNNADKPNVKINANHIPIGGGLRLNTSTGLIDAIGAVSSVTKGTAVAGGAVTTSGGVVTIQFPTVITTARGLSDGDDLSYVDPTSGEEITFEDAGTTGTVLWGAESATQVALDVNGVSKTLLKLSALDAPLTRISALESYFIGGAANNARQLDGHDSAYFATATQVNALVTGVSSVAGKTGAVTLVIGDVSGLQAALDAKLSAAVTALGGKTGAISLGTGLSIDSNNVLSVTGQAQGTVTRVDIGSTRYSPNSDGVVALPVYPTSLPASDVYAWAKAETKPSYAFSEISGKATASQVPNIESLTNFSTKVYDASASRTANYVLAAPNGSNGAATFRALVADDIPSLTTGKISDLETWISGKGYVTSSVSSLTNYYTKTEVESLLASLNEFRYEIYATISDVSDPQTNVLYLIGPTGSGSDKYEEYVYTTSWVKIGDTSIDLSDYINSVTQSGTGNYISGFTKSGNSLTLTFSTLPTELKNPNKLTFGSKEYDGSAAVSLSASDLGISSWAQAASKPSYTFSEIGSKPTTLAGYGITDAYTATEVDSLISILANGVSSLSGRISSMEDWMADPALDSLQVGSLNVIDEINGRIQWANILSKPTTLYGYGITDAVTLGTAQTITGVKTFDNNVTISNNDGNKVTLRVDGDIVADSGITASALYLDGILWGNGSILRNFYQIEFSDTDAFLRGEVDYEIAEDVYMDLLRSNKVIMSDVGFMKKGGTASQFLKADGSVDSNSYALANSVVTLTTAQTISGAKSFSSAITLSGATSAARRIYFGDNQHYLELDANGFHFSHGVYSDDFISAGGAGSSGGSGSSVDLERVWQSLTGNADFPDTKINIAHIPVTSIFDASNYYTKSEAVPSSRTVNGHALTANVTVTKADVSLGNVENYQYIEEATETYTYPV